MGLGSRFKVQRHEVRSGAVLRPPCPLHHLPRSGQSHGPYSALLLCEQLRISLQRSIRLKFLYKPPWLLNAVDGSLVVFSTKLVFLLFGVASISTSRYTGADFRHSWKSWDFGSQMVSGRDGHGPVVQRGLGACEFAKLQPPG